MTVLTVSPSLGVDGRKAYSTRGQLFDGRVDGRLIVERSPTPFCKAARALLAEGVDPTSPLIMRHAGSDDDALTSTVGYAAGRTVWDDNTGKPIFAPWVDLREVRFDTVKRPHSAQTGPDVGGEGQNVESPPPEGRS